MTRLIEQFADSFHAPNVVANIVDLATAAVALLAEERGVSFEQQLRELDQPGIVKAADVDAWLVPAAA